MSKPDARKLVVIVAALLAPEVALSRRDQGHGIVAAIDCE